MRMLLIRLTGIFLITCAIYLTIALTLIASQSPVESPVPETADKGLNFESLVVSKFESADLPLHKYKTRDGSELSFRKINATLTGGPLLVLLHGSGWHGGSYINLARSLSQNADVVIPDLRGHGLNPARRGDISYIGQLEDDIADLITQQKKPDQKVILIGHSSGGGLVIRFSGGRYGKQIDGAVLLAPFLRYNAPTTRPNSGGWSNVLVRRIVGLSMLNQVGVTNLNHLPIIQFNFPDKVLKGEQGATATTSYSYRLNASYAPRDDYRKDIAKLPPFLLLVGNRDEAFRPEQYQPVMSEVNKNGEYKILPDTTHLNIINNPRTIEAILTFLKRKDFR